MNRLTNIIFAVILAILATGGLITYALRNSSPRAASVVTAQTATEAAPADRSASTLFTELLAPAGAAQSSGTDVIGISLRFTLAALLAALLAFRPRRSMPVNRRNPYVAQTQILLAVVAAAMMIIVGDSAARAFGIFAAASLVSFRTNVRDPKEIAVLLVCLGVGLAMGVGRGDLAVALSLFVLVTLSVLEFLEPRQAFRSMQVCVETRDLDQTHEALRRIFAQQGFSTELRQFNRATEESLIGKVIYHVKLSPVVDMDRLSEQILAADRQNIGSVGWEQQKNSTYIYN